MHLRPIELGRGIGWLTRARRALLASAVLAASGTAFEASAQLASQYAYVVNRDSRSVTVIDLKSRRVVDTWRTDRNPRAIAVAPDGGRIYVAANHDLTVLDIKDPHRRVDIEFQQLPLGAFNLESTGVTVADAGRKVFVSQRISGEIVMLDLEHSDVAACLRDLVEDCSPGGAEVRIPLPFAGGEHVATSPLDGAIFVVNADGRVARGTPGTWSFAEITPRSGALPAFPGGLVVGLDGDVFVSANAGCGSSPGCVMRLDRDRSWALTRLPHDFGQVGGMDIRYRLDSSDYEVLVALPDSDAVGVISFVNRLAFSYTGLGVGPRDVAFRPFSTQVTANLAHLQRPGSSATLTFSGTRHYVEAGTTPVAVAIGPELEGRLAATPEALRWTYAQIGAHVGTQTLQLENDGYAELRLGFPEVKGRDAANFDIVSNGCAYARLDVGDSCRIELDFRAGSYDGRARLVTASYLAEVHVPHASSLGPGSFGLSARHLSDAIELELRPKPTLGSGGD